MLFIVLCKFKYAGLLCIAEKDTFNKLVSMRDPLPSWPAQINSGQIVRDKLKCTDLEHHCSDFGRTISDNDTSLLEGGDLIRRST